MRAHCLQPSSWGHCLCSYVTVKAVTSTGPIWQSASVTTTQHAEQSPVQLSCLTGEHKLHAHSQSRVYFVSPPALVLLLSPCPLSYLHITDRRRKPMSTAASKGLKNCVADMRTRFTAFQMDPPPLSPTFLSLTPLLKLFNLEQTPHLPVCQAAEVHSISFSLSLRLYLSVPLLLSIPSFLKPSYRSSSRAGVLHEQSRRSMCVCVSVGACVDSYISQSVENLQTDAYFHHYSLYTHNPTQTHMRRHTQSPNRCPML